MSAPVDAMAVLRYNAKEATKKWGPDNQDAATLAAFAELIEAGDAFWRATDFGRKACSPAIAKRFEAAADRVKGGAA